MSRTNDCLSLKTTLLSLSLMLAGCAGAPDTKPDGPPPIKTEADIRAEKGKPESVVTQADGTYGLIYSTQPNGPNCFLIRFDASGKLLSNENTLSEEGRAKIVRGMSREALLQRLCKPAGRMQTHHPFEILSWALEPFATEQPRFFDVYLHNGRVHHTDVRAMMFNAGS